MDTIGSPVESDKCGLLFPFSVVRRISVIENAFCKRIRSLLVIAFTAARNPSKSRGVNLITRCHVC